ncbi:MAG: hypothetical protein DRO15_03420 [Thermoprotei archaeon]|nr:MAG: hypothetical protein DRO15_03420 [Thermoprotei archaeon]
MESNIYVYIKGLEKAAHDYTRAISRARKYLLGVRRRTLNENRVDQLLKELKSIRNRLRKCLNGISKILETNVAIDKEAIEMIEGLTAYITIVGLEQEKKIIKRMEILIKRGLLVSSKDLSIELNDLSELDFVGRRILEIIEVQHNT